MSNEETLRIDAAFQKFRDEFGIDGFFFGFTKPNDPDGWGCVNIPNEDARQRTELARVFKVLNGFPGLETQETPNAPRA